MSIFSTFLELHFLRQKSIRFYQKKFLSCFVCWKKNKTYKKKVKFFQKPWTNPFAKCWSFSTLWELHFWGPKSFIFYPEYQKTFLSSFFCLKKHIRKRSIFWQKPFTNPFGKCRVFFALQEFHFSDQKGILYYPEYQNIFLSCFVCSKKTYKKKVEFLPKTIY